MAPEFTDSEFPGWRDGDLPSVSGHGGDHRSTHHVTPAGANVNLPRDRCSAAIGGGRR
jgi:hypothetical protein